MSSTTTYPPTLTFPPTSSPHTHTIIFLHGRGDTAPNFSRSLAFSPLSTSQTLPTALPGFKWVFPSAGVMKLAISPVHSKSQWFDVWDVTNFEDREELQADGLRVSVWRIRKIIEEEASKVDGGYERIVLAGISQGAAVSVHTLLNLNLPAGRHLGAFLGFSCRMPFPGRSLQETRKILGLEGVPEDNEVIRGTPMLLEHCVDDPLVLVEWGRGLRGSLGGFGAKVTWKEYPDGGHWFNSPRGMDDAVAF